MSTSDADRFADAIDAAHADERNIDTLQATQRDAFTAWQQKAHELAAAERAERAASNADMPRAVANLQRAQAVEQAAREVEQQAQIELNTALEQWRDRDRAAAQDIGLAL